MSFLHFARLRKVSRRAAAVLSLELKLRMPSRTNAVTMSIVLARRRNGIASPIARAAPWLPSQATSTRSSFKRRLLDIGHDERWPAGLEQGGFDDEVVAVRQTLTQRKAAYQGSIGRGRAGLTARSTDRRRPGPCAGEGGGLFGQPLPRLNRSDFAGEFFEVHGYLD